MVLLFEKVDGKVKEANWQEVTAKALQVKVLGFDTETDGSSILYLDSKGKKKKDFLNPIDHRMVGFSLAFQDGSRYYAPVRHKSGPNIPEAHALEFLRDLFSRKELSVVAHNWEFDLGVVEREGICTNSKIICTKALGWLLGKENLYGSLQLKDLIQKMTGVRPLDFRDVVKAQSSDASVADMAVYAADDGWNALYLLLSWYPEAKAAGLWRPFMDVIMPIIRVIRHQRDTGLYVDCDQLAQYRRELGPRLAEIIEEWEFLVGIRQTRREAVTERLYREFRWLPEAAVSLTKGGNLPSDRETLESLLEHPKTTDDGRRAIELLLAGEAARKTLSTYAHALKTYAEFFPDRRVRCDFWFADTGRFRSFNPNMQNLPRPNPKLPNIRAVFKPRPGFVFICADYEQLELRIMAGLSKDRLLVDAFSRGIDLHQAAADRWGITRSEAKTTNFSVIYGTTEYGLAKKRGIPKDEAKKAIDQYFRDHPGVAKYNREKTAEAKQHGGVRTYLGRFRDLSRYDGGYLARRAGNTPIQGTAADATNSAMIRLFNCWKDKGWLGKDAFIPMSVHDEILCEVREDLRDTAIEDLRHAMEDALPSFPLKLTASIGAGYNWYEAKK